VLRWKVGREVFRVAPLSQLYIEMYMLFFILSFLCRSWGPLLESLVTVTRKVGKEVFKSPLSATI